MLKSAFRRTYFTLEEILKLGFLDLKWVIIELNWGSFRVSNFEILVKRRRRQNEFTLDPRNLSAKTSKKDPVFRWVWKGEFSDEIYRKMRVCMSEI